MPDERRVVTVLFADVTGSTALGETNDPEDTRALLGRYYAVAREVVAEHGGTLEKFIGDAIMAVFGIPVAHGDDADRALAAALALRERVAADALTSSLVLRIGVNTGEVVAARESEAGDFLVTGDAVNVAARLQQHAEPGAIFVGERTRRAVSLFRFAEEQTIAVKGKREPILGSVLVERVAERRAARAPFLGRDRDLAQLDLVAQRAFGERRPQLVTVTAPAGTGKSRLVEEFAARLPEAGAMIATAQCLPYGAAVTFLPLRGLARGLLAASPEDDLTPALRRAFAAGGHSEADAARLASLIGTTLGDASDSERRDRDEVFTAWRLFIEALAVRGPLVVVFEDIHWASDTLLDLVEHVTTSRTTGPLVMFALARPELLDRRPTWGGGRRNFTSIGLEPLTPEETLRLVSVMTEGVPGPMAKGIVERAGGNPFFVGELVRAYEELHRAGKKDDDIQLPDTVHATVLARIDALPRGERSVLEYAAVAGRTARIEAVRALLPDASLPLIANAFDALVERDLLVPQGGGAYTFRHIVIREVAYATLPRVDRVRAHLQLAQWLERDAPARANELAELVAYHYRQAIALSPGGRLPDGLDVTTVVSALERAAEVAQRGAAYAEARQHLQEAIRLAPPAEHLRLNERVGDVMQFGDAAITGYAEAFARWQAAGAIDASTGARLAVKQLGVAGRWPGSISEAMDEKEFDELAAVAERLLDKAPDESLSASLACARAFAATRGGVTDRATADALVRQIESARRTFASSGDVEGESGALDALAAAYRATGRYADAFDAQEQRLLSSDRLSLLERIDAWSVSVWDLVYLGRFDEAVDRYGAARAALRAGEPEYILSHAASWAAYAAMLCGRWDETLQLADTLLEMREQSPITVGRFTFQGWVSALRVASARLDSTRHARYRSTFTAIADVERLRPAMRPLWLAVLERDGALARTFLSQPDGSRDRKGELVAMVLLELGELIPEAELVALEQQSLADPPMLTVRVDLARALRAGPDETRRAIADLDARAFVADAARAAALLALRTHDPRDRADAERRLGALGDRAFSQRLAEEW
jgi:class 3 adenylate cyclase/tetratricopeptide (TPR) repeat protein